MNVRRVVTGQHADGTSVFVSDEQVEPVTVSLLPGAAFHRLWASDTVDYDFVLSGEVWLELDHGAQVQLRAGDCVVQNGTRHAWRNKSSAPCVIAFALVGAQRAG